MLDDLKGPMILSATIHALLVLVAAIWSFIEPDKKPEELIFELYSAPPPAATPQQTQPDVTYESEDIELPDYEEIEVELPVLPPEEPEVVLTPEPEPPPQPKRLTREEFIKQHGEIKEQPPRQKPKPTQRPDISKQVKALEESLKQISNLELPASVMSNISPQEQNELAQYFGTLKAMVSRSVEQHPLSGNLLETRVEFTLHPNGRVSDPRVVGSSGDNSFDRKVIAAFNRLGILGPPPGVRKSEKLILTVYQEER